MERRTEKRVTLDLTESELFILRGLLYQYYRETLKNIDKTSSEYKRKVYRNRAEKIAKLLIEHKEFQINESLFRDLNEIE